MQHFQQIIDDAWENRAGSQPGNAPAKVGEAVEFVIAQLDDGNLRVAEKIDGEWITHQWIKKAVLLSFRLERQPRHATAATLRYYDKVPTKFAEYDAGAVPARRLPRRARRRGAPRLPSSARTWC